MTDPSPNRGDGQGRAQLSIGLTPDNQILLLAATIVGLVVVPIVFWIVVSVGGLIGRVLGIKTGLPGLLVLLALPIGLLTASLALDQSGQTIPGQVIDKRERVQVNAEGGWSDNVSLVVRYSVDGTSLPPFKSLADALIEAELAKNTRELATLYPPAREFDRFRPGDSIDLRILRIRDVVSLVRLTDQSTWTMLPWATILDVVGLVVVVIVVWRLRKTPLGYWPLAGLILVASIYPLATAYQTWQIQENFSDATDRASATVQNVTRVTEVSLTDRSTDVQDTIQVPQPYDVVQLTFVPPGYPDAIIAIDAVDVDTSLPARFEPAMSAEVVYPASNPRAARILNQTRSHYLKTTLGWYLNDGVLLLVGAIVVFGASVVGSRLKRAILKPPAAS